MDKHQITKRIECFAPLNTAEPWDCSGWIVETPQKEIQKIMLALTITDSVFKQACEQDCDMIISHHPLFEVPLKYKNINMYCAHTNLDIANGGTTDTLIKNIGFNSQEIIADGFLRLINTNTTVVEFAKLLKQISPNMRYVNNKNIKTLEKIAFCAGSGTEFIQEAYNHGANALVTGDLKFHTALDSPIVVFDVGHFESEIQVLRVFENLINDDCEFVYANEHSPFVY